MLLWHQPWNDNCIYTLFTAADIHDSISTNLKSDFFQGLFGFIFIKTKGVNQRGN